MINCIFPALIRVISGSDVANNSKVGHASNPSETESTEAFPALCFAKLTLFCSALSVRCEMNM